MNETSDEAEVLLDDCWNTIGVWGSGQERCPKLESVVHCHNCSIYSDAGRRLFERTPVSEYVDEWTRNLSAEKNTETERADSLLVFRIGNEWFGLATHYVAEVSDTGQIHSLPHNRNRNIKGLINFRGELYLCVSLGNVLGLAKGNDSKVRRNNARERLLILESEGDRYAAPVSEILGVERYPIHRRKLVPDTIAKASGTYLTGIIDDGECHIGCLDAELLFHALRRKTV